MHAVSTSIHDPLGYRADLKIKIITESKVGLLAARQGNEPETRCWGKE